MAKPVSHSIQQNGFKGQYEQPLTVKDVQEVLPGALKNKATQPFVDRINTIVKDSMVAEQVRTNFVTYASVLAEGRFSVADYLKAVVYVSYKLMGATNQDAYRKTFPERYKKFKTAGATDQTISAYVSMYNKGKLVNLVLEQTLVPTWVLNQGLYQRAINTQAAIMQDQSVSPKVRSDAADSLMRELKRPEATKVEMDIGIKVSDEMTDLRDMLGDLAKTQKDLIERGVPTQKIAHQQMGEIIDVTPNEDDD